MHSLSRGVRRSKLSLLTDFSLVLYRVQLRSLVGTPIVSGVRALVYPILVGGMLVLASCAQVVERPGNPMPSAAPIAPTATAADIAANSPTETPPLLPTPTPTTARAGTAGPAETPTTAPDNTVIPDATPPPTEAVTPTPMVIVTPTSTPDPPPTMTASSPSTPDPGFGGEIPSGLFLRITNLPKESVVRTETVSLSGITTVDAVVSVNGVLVDVDAEGRFTSKVALRQEPNVIEVVASDFRGNKVSAVLTIIYIP